MGLAGKRHHDYVDVDGAADDRDNDADDDEHHGKKNQDASHGKSGHPLNKTSTFTAEVLQNLKFAFPR